MRSITTIRSGGEDTTTSADIHPDDVIDATTLPRLEAGDLPPF